MDQGPQTHPQLQLPSQKDLATHQFPKESSIQTLLLSNGFISPVWGAVSGLWSLYQKDPVAFSSPAGSERERLGSRGSSSQSRAGSGRSQACRGLHG